MKGTLSILRTRTGLAIEKPRQVPVVFSIADKKAHALVESHGLLVVVLEVVLDVRVSADGLLIKGLEEHQTTRGVILRYQEWWIAVPGTQTEKGTVNG
jgi:hypothetical protein